MFTFKKTATALALGVFLFGSTTPGFANTLTEKQKKIEEQRKANDAEQQKAAEELKKAEKAITKEQAAINKLDSKIQDVIFDVAKKKKDIKKTKVKIAKLEKQIKSYEAKMEQREELMKNRMATMQKNGGSSVDWAEFVFNSSDLSDLLSRMVTAETIQRHDTQIFKEYEETKEKLASAQAEVKKERDALVKQKKALEKRKKDLDKQMKERKKKIAKLKKNKVAVQSELMSLEDMEAMLSAQEAAIAAERAAQQSVSPKKQSSSSSAASAAVSATTSIPAKGGMFQRPASGSLTQGWGGASGQHGYSFHNGVDIANSVGTPIYAAQTGTVIRAGWGGAYGNHVMIAHVINGQVWTTVYAHLSSVSVQTGQRVKQGQNIGRMGNTGNSFGSHLHFEVHRGGYSYSSSSAGSTVNPLSFL